MTTLTQLQSQQAPTDTGDPVDPLVSELEEHWCLSVCPFDGDFGHPNDRCLKDKMGNARKAGPCSLCGEEIKPGDRIRMSTYIFDGELHTYRWCNACCAAMAASWQDDGAAYEARIQLGRSR